MLQEILIKKELRALPTFLIQFHFIPLLTLQEILIKKELRDPAHIFTKLGEL